MYHALPNPGTYYAEFRSGVVVGAYYIPFTNAGDLPADTEPANNAGFPNRWKRCLELYIQPSSGQDAMHNPYFT